MITGSGIDDTFMLDPEPSLVMTDDHIFIEPDSVDQPCSIEQLVAYITSSRVIDYTSMSDFFLTFRLYSSAPQVLELLLTRMFSAMRLNYQDAGEVGRDIAVRTFVVLRHWIDNYFADDFLPNLELRQRFVYAIAELERHQYASTSPQFALIFQQIAKVWNRRLRTYWDVAQLDSWPLVAGGEFGAQELDTAGRRRTLLSFYSGHIDPMTTPEGESRQLGSIIRGGLLVSTDPKVACIRTTPKKHKPKSRFFRRSRPEQQNEVQLEGKVDLLALKVFSELEALLKVRQQLTDVPLNGVGGVEPSQAVRDGNRLGLVTSESQNTIKAHQTVDTLNIGQVLDDSASFYDDDDGDSVDDSYINLRRSTVANNLLDDIPFDRGSYVSFSSLSTVSYSIADSSTTHSVATGSQTDDNISLLSELTSGYEMAPCAGFNKHVAAELAAIPDDSMQEDAILVAIQKLEGTWQETHTQHFSPGANPNLRMLCNAIRSVPSFVSADTKLYSQAFASATNLAHGISGLAIPQCSTPPPFFLGDEVQRHSSSTISTVQQRRSPTDITKNHVPFILSLSAETLAQQMTLLEKDALDQVDWKELVEIGWTQTSTDVHSWLGFLASHNIRGVDVVTARFNLVLNWVRSEVLLCRQASLQARTLQRFIHVALECEKLQNFATVFQLVLALTSEILRTRISTAWSLVDKPDLNTLTRLEQLVSPLRNFHNLRAAHKKIKFSSGCIPFTGIYLADLLYNNQKPNWTDGKINFAKFKAASSLTRSLIQCIEWSKNYRIMPKPDILSKCLYLQSLTAEEMDWVAR